MDQQLIEQVDQLLAPYFDTLGKRIQGMKTVVNVPEPRVNVTVPDIKIPKIVVPKIELPTINVPTPRVVVPKPEVTVNVDKVKIENWPEFPTTERFDDTEILKSLQKLIQKPAGGGGGAHSTTFLNTSGKYVDVSSSNPLPVDITDTSLTTAQGTAAANSGAWPMRLINTDNTDNSVLLSGSYMQKVGVYADGDKYVRGIVAEGASLSQVEPVFVGAKDPSGNSIGNKADASGNLYTSIAGSKAVLLDADDTLLTGIGEAYTGSWIQVMGKYSALNLASFINVSGFGGATRYAVVGVEFSSDGVTFDGTFVNLAVGYSDANPANVSVPILDNYARLKITNAGSDDYDWSAAGGAPRTTLVGVPAGNGSFVRTVGSGIVIGDVDPVAPPVMIGGRDTTNPTNVPMPWAMTTNAGGEGVGHVIGTSTTITSNAVITAERGGTTGTLSNVAEATSSTTLASSSTSRRGFIVFNDTSNPLKLKFGSTASATSFTVIVAAATHWQMPLALYTGTVTGISVGTGGTWRVTTW